MTLKFGVGFLVLCIIIQSVRSQNGYGASPPQPQKSVEPGEGKVNPHGEGQPINPNWWMNQGAFQKPKNHPGVEKSDGGAAGAPVNDPLNPSPECMLRLKSDCYGGRQKVSGSAVGAEVRANPNGPSSNYQLDGFSAYPVYTAYVIPTIGTFNPPSYQQPSPRPQDPLQQNSILYSNQEQVPLTFDPSQSPQYYPNYEQIPPSSSQNSDSHNKNQASYNYRPAVVPYKAPPPPAPATHNQKTSGYSNLPQSGSLAGGAHGQQHQVVPGAHAPAPVPAQDHEDAEALPYPGCPAAMLCVPEEFCDAKGMSAGKPIQLSEAEKLYRVALGACSAPTTGQVGVCCRDPDYKDPWPMMGAGPDDQRQGKGISYDDGQYRPQVYGSQQYDDGQYRPPVQVEGKSPVKGVTTHDNGQYRPQITTQLGQSPGQQLNPYPQYQQHQGQGYQQHQGQGYQQQYPVYQDPYPAQQQQHQHRQQNSGYPAQQQHREQNSGHFAQPQQQHREPNSGHPAQQHREHGSGSTNPDPTADLGFGLRAGFPKRRNFVEVCPNSMKCLRESYCQVPNPNEGNTDLFDIRVGLKRNTAPKLKCRQDNLPVDGVCCYLREDYMSQVTTRPLLADIPATVPEPTNQACGLRRHKTVAPDTEFGEFPWQAWITAGENVCSGAIITNKIIATTASCIYSARRGDVTVRVGDWDQASVSEKKPHQDLEAELLIPHPQFNPTLLSSNVGLIITREPIKFDYHSGRVCLPQPVTNWQGRKCIVTGWGSLNSRQIHRGNASRIETLEQADVSVLSQTDCERQFRNGGSNSKISKSGMCVIPEQRQNLCLGDEGSPLVCEMTNTGEYILAGFLDGGRRHGGNCEQEGVAAISTNATAIVDWIHTFVKQNPEDRRKGR